MSLYKKTKKKNQIIKIITPAIILVCLFSILYITNDKSSIVSKITEEEYNVEIVVTQNHGNKFLYSRSVNIEPGITALDVLQQSATVETKHSDGFVESINGIKSTFYLNQKNDWFYYINGMLSPLGSSEYILHPGDIERWDFHNWNSDRKTTAIISNFPEPFLHGFHGQIRRTTIVYKDEFETAAKNLFQYLKNIDVPVSLSKFNYLNEKEKSENHLILIDQYSNNLISELNKNSQKLGWFIEFDNNKLISYNEMGEKNENFNHGGVIIATQNPWNPRGNWNGENVVWILSGINSEDVNTSVNFLLENNDEILYSTSIIVYENKIISVP